MWAPPNYRVDYVTPRPYFGTEREGKFPLPELRYYQPKRPFDAGEQSIASAHVPSSTNIGKDKHKPFDMDEQHDVDAHQGNSPPRVVEGGPANPGHGSPLHGEVDGLRQRTAGSSSSRDLLNRRDEPVAGAASTLVHKRATSVRRAHDFRDRMIESSIPSTLSLERRLFTSELQSLNKLSRVLRRPATIEDHNLPLLEKDEEKFVGGHHRYHSGRSLGVKPGTSTVTSSLLPGHPDAVLPGASLSRTASGSRQILLHPDHHVQMEVDAAKQQLHVVAKAHLGATTGELLDAKEGPVSTKSIPYDPHSPESELKQKTRIWVPLRNIEWPFFNPATRHGQRELVEYRKSDVRFYDGHPGDDPLAWSKSLAHIPANSPVGKTFKLHASRAYLQASTQSNSPVRSASQSKLPVRLDRRMSPGEPSTFKKLTQLLAGKGKESTSDSVNEPLIKPEQVISHQRQVHGPSLGVDPKAKMGAMRIAAGTPESVIPGATLSRTFSGKAQVLLHPGHDLTIHSHGWRDRIELHSAKGTSKRVALDDFAPDSEGRRARIWAPAEGVVIRHHSGRSLITLIQHDLRHYRLTEPTDMGRLSRTLAQLDHKTGRSRKKAYVVQGQQQPRDTLQEEHQGSSDGHVKTSGPSAPGSSSVE
ncbi:hypothetical protein CBOM_05092 [Ceraceosorus bombacis]|uniref:Uncharacterized protein n=1 Tax=Ceraceosorus bombacis TaxID=401625 RepID=A0A0P1BJ30_9BASI|nr:hypothetical protein CBOM_05092 [Ceraceosorus bombacis]